jgi:type II secretory pathway pseudopilin PulG
MAFDIGGLLSGIGSIFGASSAKNAINGATQAQINGADQAANQYKAASERQQMQFQPFYDVGWNALQSIHNATGGNGEAGKVSALERFRDYNPGYEYQRSEGLRGIDAGFNASGARLSGGALMALQDRGNNLADQNYNSWLDRLYQSAGMGQTAAAQSGALDAAAAGGMADAYTYKGDAKAAGAVAKNNVNSQLLGSLGSLAGFYGFGN